MKVVGITGGIGMGKSHAASVLVDLGARVVDTDEIARALTAPGQPALDEIRAAFGSEVFQPSGELDRGQLAQRIFSDSKSRVRLEEILHPKISVEWQKQVEQWKVEGSNWGFVIIPLLFEKKYESQFDAVVCVACLAETQLHRLRARGWSDEEISRRNASQLAVAEKITRSDHLIWTEGSLRVHAVQWERTLTNWEK